MKIVIDIDEKEYEEALTGVFNITAFNEAISKHSIPLEKVFEDIKTEINEVYNDFKDKDSLIANGINICRRIIDKRISGKETKWE